MRLLSILLVGLGLSACGPTSGDRTRDEGSAARATTPASARTSASAAASVAPPPSAAAPPSASASVAPAPEPVDLSKSPVMVDDAGKPLGQTEDKPSIDSPAFRARLDLLWQAIVANDPEVAAPVFFPVMAYEQVKDIKAPAADHKSRLLKAFARDIKEYHGKIGPDPRGTKLLGLEIDDKRMKWMKRGDEGNKLPYWRLTRSKIRYADAGGTERTLELTSLISWRGEWFVVHLHGFK